ncbi:hypothetical protein V5N11_027753 [Cardamine amara subsp. amara]|uniref:Uncharacterized protein n=1 Tax=Cardamine amara subsp. amara TaxID=228776 RepID=A0ABD1A805_CARAN
MGRPGRIIIGKGEVTRTQVAFIVDRYLCDNRFFNTRALFRSEASSLIPKSSLHHVPIGLMTLDDMLNGYVDLKHQKLALEQERVRLDQEKFRVQNLLHGMQNVMNAYNASFIPPPPPPPAPAPAPTPPSTYQQKNYNVPSSGFTQHNTPKVMSVSMSGNKGVNSENVSTPLTSKSEPGKQKVSQVSVRVDRGNVSTPSTSRSEPGNRKVPEVSVRVDSENVATPSTSQSVPAKRKVHEVSEEAPPVTRKPRITTVQENSTGTDLVSTSLSVSDPEIDDLLNMDFLDVEYVDKSFPISEIFNFDVDSTMKTGLWSSPESWNGNPEPTVTETTQGKDMSTQGVCFGTLAYSFSS